MASQDWFEKDFYAILGVPQEADAATIKKTYRKLARDLHPDHNVGDAKAEERQLTLDRAMGDRWLVTAGLRDGDQLIVEGLQRIRPGVPVKAVPYAPAVAGAAPTAGGPRPAAK